MNTIIDSITNAEVPVAVNYSAGMTGTEVHGNKLYVRDAVTNELTPVVKINEGSATGGTVYSSYGIAVATDTPTASISGTIDSNTRFGVIPLLFTGVYCDLASQKEKPFATYFTVRADGTIQLDGSISTLLDYLKVQLNVSAPFQSSKPNSGVSTTVRIVACAPDATTDDYLCPDNLFDPTKAILLSSSTLNPNGSRDQSLVALDFYTEYMNENDSTVDTKRNNWRISLQAVTENGVTDQILAKGNGQISCFLIGI